MKQKPTPPEDRIVSEDLKMLYKDGKNYENPAMGFGMMLVLIGCASGTLVLVMNAVFR